MWKEDQPEQEARELIKPLESFCILTAVGGAVTWALALGSQLVELYRQMGAVVEYKLWVNKPGFKTV